MNVILNPPVAAVGVTAEFAVSWSEGTDLQFDIDFGDGNTFQWHWQVANFFLSTLDQLSVFAISLCVFNSKFYYATIAYHVGLNAVLGLPHPGPTS